MLEPVCRRRATWIDHFVQINAVEPRHLRHFERFTTNFDANDRRGWPVGPKDVPLQFAIAVKIGKLRGYVDLAARSAFARAGEDEVVRGYVQSEAADRRLHRFDSR